MYVAQCMIYGVHCTVNYWRINKTYTVCSNMAEYLPRRGEVMGESIEAILVEIGNDGFRGWVILEANLLRIL